MLNLPSRVKKPFDRPGTGAKEPLKKKRQKLTPQTLNQHLVDQKLINFDQRRYPFPNKPIPTSCIYKTTVSINNLFGDSMQKLANIVHPNIIAVKKILRSSIKCSPGKLSVNNYSLIYEVVPYQLKYVGCGIESLQKIYKKVAAVDFRQIIASVSMFLNSHKVFHTIKLADIGITEEGVLKIYVPADVVIRPGELSKDRQEHQRNNQKIISWCETTFTNSEISECISDEEGQKPHMSRVKCKKCESQSQSSVQSQDQADIFLEEKPCLGSSKDLTKNYLQSTAMKSSGRSFQSELSKISAFQKQKMKKINSQIKNIKERLQMNIEQVKKKDFDHAIIQRRGIPKATSKPSIFQSQRLVKRGEAQDFKFNDKDNRRYRQSVQQNINCINIYNNPNKNIQYLSPKESNRLSNNQVISYTIKPLKDSKPLTPLCNSKNYVIQHHGGYFDNPFEDIQNEESFDTYDIQASNPKDEQEEPKYRQTLNNLQRESSKRNILIQNNAKGQQLAKNKTLNHVQSSKFTTQSAGPLQFKNFINMYIKPQFLAKKSNIYEDPMEEESQPSTHNQINDTKPVSHHQNATLEIPKSKGSEKKQPKMMNQNRQQTESEEKIQRIQSDKRLTVLTMPLMSELRSGNFVKGKEPKYLQRVQQIVKKSQNAIKILQKARKGCNNNFRGRMSP